MTKSISRATGILILLMWLASLALPVFTTCRAGYDHVGGWFVLMMGWMGVIIVQPAWFANIAILAIAILLIVRRRAPIWLGIIAAGLAACAWYFTDMVDDTGNVPICHYHAGYWLWLATAGVALLATFIPRPAQPAS
jgi:hypothetical protein